MEAACQTPGCGNKVTKAGHALCLPCWKKNRAGGKPAAAKKESAPKGETLGATKLGEHFGLKPARVNNILHELGWIFQEKKGWSPTPLATAAGAVGRVYSKNGIPYVVWPQSILEHKIFKEAVQSYRGENAAAANKPPDPDDFRAKFPATFRANDGHMVRSKSEVVVDNYLYACGIVHAYERKVPVEEELYCDFYLPRQRDGGGGVYIEYWGLENDPKYRRRKEQKIALYQNHGLSLIELTDKEVANVDDHLPRLLRPFGINVD